MGVAILTLYFLHLRYLSINIFDALSIDEMKEIYSL